MKTLNVIPILLTILMILVSQLTFADDAKYIAAMQKNIETISKAQSIEELQSSVNSFERIGAAEKTKWEPQYYAAFGYIIMATRESDGAKKDGYLDRAMTAIEAGKKIAPGESEIVALEGFAYMIRVTVDPASRGPQFAGQSIQTYQKALELNAENPRALALLAQMQYGTAQFFGSSTTEACAIMHKSLEKFETYKSDNPLAPRWGKETAESMKENCK